MIGRELVSGSVRVKDHLTITNERIGLGSSEGVLGGAMLDTIEGSS